MPQSTLTDKGQTTVPIEVREALKIKPRQQLDWTIQADGTVVVRPQPEVMELFGSLKLKRPVVSPQEEKRAAREAMARESVTKGKK